MGYGSSPIESYEAAALLGRLMGLIVLDVLFWVILYVFRGIALRRICKHAGKKSALCWVPVGQTALVGELAGKKIGIVGLGHTGMKTARIALAFGMEVCAFTSKSALQLPPEIKKMELDELFAECDVVSLHCPLTPDTREIVNARRLGLMKPTAILINTGRGPLVNEQDLADALNAGRIYAAGVDVLSQEPPRAGNPLLTARHCYITPHIAWASTAARERLMRIAVDNVKAYMEGKPVNVVNK